MSGMAEAFIVGTLGRDPEMRYTGDGTAIASLSLATNRKVKGEDHTDWHKVTFFGKRAETIGEFLKKGNQLAVSGVLTHDKYTDSNGVERISTQVIGNTFSFVGGARDAEGTVDTPTASVAAPSVDGDDIPF